MTWNIPSWLLYSGAVVGLVSGLCAIFATMWAVVRLLAPLRSLSSTLETIERRTRSSVNTARRAAREAAAARRVASETHEQVVAISHAVDSANVSLVEIEKRSHYIRSGDIT